MSRKKKDDPELFVPNAHILGKLQGATAQEFKELKRREFESSVCEQYYLALGFPRLCVAMKRDEDGFLGLNDLPALDYGITLLFAKRNRITWNDIYGALPGTIVNSYFQRSESRITILDDDSGSYRGIVLARGFNVSSRDVSGKVFICSHADGPFILARPYDLFKTLVNAGFLSPWGGEDNDKVELSDN